MLSAKRQNISAEKIEDFFVLCFALIAIFSALFMLEW
jgi:hypothetical protein